ncbi:ADP-ribosylation factor GTPase-activating protein AGD3-like isoform X2 [Lolium rigidum]|uniref:ADP-ribosylation factor GTPase-activating protein AGD3-like isoform X2 n=1 Tax=Lolium rigidum TaxID=89674 RepID=UPI001F5D60B1|nr:ADP-ribosylation factor GTPase-activating protein AGD3-like isoform X2 [Lolium rigidum]
MYFARLDDSPMFRTQIQSLEESSEILRERCLKFHKGCRKYTEGLGEAYDGDIAFASSLETFGGGHNDPISVAFGGPVMNKFTIALREIGTYKEVLRSQVEHMLNDRLLNFVDVDLHDVKDARKRFDKASLVYDQVRERYLSLKKGTRADITIAIEEELHSARSSFEQARFNLVTAISHIEAKKRFEFLEAVSATMDSHLRYFKQGYELLHQMEPYINQVLAYSQQSRERANKEQASLVERMHEYKKQIDRESRSSANCLNDSHNVDGIQTIGRSSHKMIEAVMQSSSKGKVQTIRQGYLSKRSSNLRGDWKRRFFVLDSRGMLYYYRKQITRPPGVCPPQRPNNTPEHGSGLLSRLFSSHYHGIVHDEKSVARHTVNLLTSTIKVDAEQSDLRFCFRIISPMKIYTLQAESAMDQMDWIEKITGVIASLLSSQSPEQSPRSCGHDRSASESSSYSSSAELETSTSEDLTLEKNTGNGHHDVRSAHHHRTNIKPEKPIDLLRRVDGNTICADCGASEPDWASLNLGALLCIECSGVHRNLGVHISKVRSLTLDVRVWEPSVINLFQSLGNMFVNRVWEETLNSSSIAYSGELSINGPHTAQYFTVSKPKHSDPFSAKEKFIHAKYADKEFVRRHSIDEIHVAQQMWDNVTVNDKKGVYSLIVASHANVNLVYGQMASGLFLNLGKALLQEQPASPPDGSPRFFDCDSQEKASPKELISRATSSHVDDMDDRYEGFSLLHLACRVADVGMVELLLQYGASVNASDSRGRTPLHHCILRGRHLQAKLLLSRGANSHATDRDGRSALQYAMDRSTSDEDMLMLLEEHFR